MYATELVEASSLTKDSFLWEVEQFCKHVSDPALSLAEKQRAYDVIVRHAALLDPHGAGYEDAGVALKEALSRWLDVQIASRH